MALDKNNKNYYYNLGRTVAIVEIIENQPISWKRKVFENAFVNLPYNLKNALKNSRHNIHNELIEPADIVLNGGEIPKEPMTAVDMNGLFWIGYYHEADFLDRTYKGVFGKVETTIEKHVPERVDISGDSQPIEDLRR